MSILSSSLVFFIVFILLRSCNARSSAVLLNPDFADNKVLDKVKASIESNVNQGTYIEDIDVTKASMKKKTEEYSSRKIQDQVKYMKVNGRKEEMNMENAYYKLPKKHVKNQNDTNIGFDSLDYPQPRTHPPSHN